MKDNLVDDKLIFCRILPRTRHNGRLRSSVLIDFRVKILYVILNLREHCATSKKVREHPEYALPKILMLFCYYFDCGSWDNLGARNQELGASTYHLSLRGLGYMFRFLVHVSFNYVV